MTCAIIIPARYQSSRFPGKVLASLAGQPMIRHVWDRAMAVPDVERVIIATDDARVAAVAREFGADVMMTSDTCQSGTDRVAEAAALMSSGASSGASEIIVNLQGDLPLIPPRLIVAARQPLLDDPTVIMSTLKRPMARLEELRSPNTVKVVTDRDGNALYFSRAPIPMARDIQAADPLPRGVYFHHLGLYVYRKSFLTTFAKLSPGRLEQIEQLEQLRALEHGYRIRVVQVDEGTVEVNAPDDLVAAEAAYHGRG